MTIAFFDCYAGASGDMFLGAWLDVGIDRQAWRDMLNQLKVDGYDLDIRTVYKNGIRATKVDVNLHPVADSLTKPHHPHLQRPPSCTAL